MAGAPDAIRSISLDGTVRTHGVGLANVIKQASTGDIFAAGSGVANILYVFDNSQQKFVSTNLQLDYHVGDNIRIEDIAFGEDEKLYLASNEGVLIVEKKDEPISI